MESSKEQLLYEIDILNVFSVTFNQFNSSLMNKSSDFIEKKGLNVVK